MAINYHQTPIVDVIDLSYMQTYRKHIHKHSITQNEARVRRNGKNEKPSVPVDLVDGCSTTIALGRASGGSLVRLPGASREGYVRVSTGDSLGATPTWLACY